MIAVVRCLRFVGVRGSGCAWSSHGRASVGGIMRWTGIWRNSRTGRAELRIFRSSLSPPIPEPSSATTGGVVVGWRWTITLFTLVMTHKSYLHESSHDKEQAIGDMSNLLTRSERADLRSDD